MMIFLAMEMVTKEGSLKSGNSEFTYSELVAITRNFTSTIGQGGFGNVHLGTLVDGTQVAVKLRSQSSMQGSKEFRAEVRYSSPSSVTIKSIHVMLKYDYNRTCQYATEQFWIAGETLDESSS